MSTSLRLDWTLSTPEARQASLSNLDLSRLSDSDLSVVADYLLWSLPKSERDSVQLQSKSGDWTGTSSSVQSLDELLAVPTFNESVLRKPDDPVYTTPKRKLSRKQIRESAPTGLLADFEVLWHQIDGTDYVIERYELNSGKRNKIRGALLERLTPSEREQFDKQAGALSAYNYLKLRHLLIELRRQQYTLKDFYRPELWLRPSATQTILNPVQFEAEVEVRPMGLYGSRIQVGSKKALKSGLCAGRIGCNDRLSQVIWRSDTPPYPRLLEEAGAEKALSQLLWKKSDPDIEFVFDFRDTGHLDRLVWFREELEDQIETNESDPASFTLRRLLQTLDYYVEFAHLKPVHLTILRERVHHTPNDLARDRIKEEFGFTYTINYLSTIYHQQILPSIAQAAQRHREICENLFFPENFKTCIDCGRTLLRDEVDFVRRSRVKDGFSCRCKECEKKLRDRRKAQ